jgi:hypothetical protein
MAVTPVYAIPYVESSDLVANYPGVSESLAEQVEDKLPTYAATAPSSPSVGQVWIDSSGSPIGKVWDGSAWTIFSGAGAANFSDTATGTYTDGGIDYKYITFTASGTLTVTAAGFADILVVGGGAGGYREASASYGAGGGGAGGYLAAPDVYLAADTHTVTIGAGGAGGTGNFIGLSGATSRIDNFYVTGGGGGGGPAGNSSSGYLGGSGGGGGATAGAGGAGTTGLGSNGGTGTGTPGSGGGGGGASAVGGAASSTVGGAGGAGTSSDYTGSSVTRAGGGGGGSSNTPGAGGSGGGGAGGKTGVAAGNGTLNTGGGGGGMSGTSTAGNGGSGIVIVRVKV